MTAVIALLAISAACGTSGMSDMDTWTDSDGVGRGTLTLVTGGPLVLGLGEERSIEGTYRDPAGNLADVDLTASLQGNAYDSSLGSTSLESGVDVVDGQFSILLRAGTVVTTFVLRALAEDGASAEVEVEVSEPPSTSLVVGAHYAGRRTVDFYRIMISQGEAGACSLPPADPLQSMSTPDAELPVTVPHLPAGLSLAITISGAWCPEGVTDPASCPSWIRGCSDGVTAGIDTPTEVTVTLIDEPSEFASTSFESTVVLDTGLKADEWAGALLAPATDLVDESGDPARFVIDGIYARIASEIGLSEADVFDTSRLASDLDGVVAAALAPTAGTLTEELAILRTSLASDIDPLVVEGVLEGDFWGSADQVASHGITGIGGPDGILDSGEILIAAPPVADVEITYESDLAILEPHFLPAGLGEVLLGVLEGITIPSLDVPPSPSGAGPVDAWLEARIDCAAVAVVLAVEAPVSPSTDAAWYADACAQVLSGVSGGVSNAAAALDASHPAIEIGGSCDFLDVTGYAVSDHSCSGPLDGVSWGGVALEGPHSIVLERPPAVLE